MAPHPHRSPRPTVTARQQQRPLITMEQRLKQRITMMGLISALQSIAMAPPPRTQLPLKASQQ